MTYFNLAADECIVVVSPEPTSITDAYAMIKIMSTQHGEKHFKLLMNMVRDESEAKAVFLNLIQATDRFLSGVSLAYCGYLPRDEKVPAAVRQRKPFVALFPEAAASQGYPDCPAAGGDSATIRRQRKRQVFRKEIHGVAGLCSYNHLTV